MTTVRDIVRLHLAQGGFDGLYCDDCACTVDDLMPCDEIGIGECEPGMKSSCPSDCGEHGFHIAPRVEPFPFRWTGIAGTLRPGDRVLARIDEGSCSPVDRHLTNATVVSVNYAAQTATLDLDADGKGL